MITIIYRLIVVMILALLMWNLFSEDDWRLQVNAALVCIPLVLRALMIK